MCAPRVPREHRRQEVGSGNDSPKINLYGPLPLISPKETALIKSSESRLILTLYYLKLLIYFYLFVS